MNFSLGFLRQYLRIFQDRAAATRVFFPDEKARLWRARTQRPGGGAASSVFSTNCRSQATRAASAA